MLTGYLALGSWTDVTGRIHDVEQKVLQSPYDTETVSGPIYCHIFFLIAILEEAFIENII
jgi:hypothetical protein